MPSSSMAGLGPPRAPGVNTLGSLSAQSVMKPPGPPLPQPTLPQSKYTKISQKCYMLGANIC